MLTFPLGPLALPVAPVLLLLAVFGASWVASRLARRAGQGGAAGGSAVARPGENEGDTATATATGMGAGIEDGSDAARARGRAAADAVFQSAWIGLLGARLVHVALHAGPYLAAPLSILDLRDGGWNAAGGALSGAAWLLWRARRTPQLRRALAGGALAGLAFWIAASAALGPHRTPALPALTVHALEDGRPVELTQAAAGRPVVVNLWASWCGPCRQEMPVLAAAQQREADVGFLFVNQGESAGAIRAYLDDQDLRLREVLLDPGSRLGPAVGSRGLPTTLFYDARGRLVDAHVGVLNAAALEARLRTLRAAP